MKNFSSQTGFALLYAVLLTGIILTIGLGLSAILAKQIILSSTGASSQVAYYAANSGKECVLHWGINGGMEDGIYKTAFGGYVVGPDGGLSYVTGGGLLDEITCGDSVIDIPDEPDDMPDGEGKVFYLDPVNIDNYCVEMTVILPEDGLSTVISTGYNLPCTNANDNSNPRRVEREIKGEGNFATPF